MIDWLVHLVPNPITPLSDYKKKSQFNTVISICLMEMCTFIYTLHTIKCVKNEHNYKRVET